MMTGIDRGLKSLTGNRTLGDMKNTKCGIGGESELDHNFQLGLSIHKYYRNSS